MLLGAAYVRLGQKERGNVVLSEAMETSSEAHATVRAELAVQLGIAKFRLGAYDEAEQLFAKVSEDQDVVYAHALEYRGWVAQARADFPGAARWFRDALTALLSCRRRDKYVEAKSLYGLTLICAELVQTEDWSLVERRVRRFDWSADGLASWNFWVHLASSMMCETTGDIAGARRWARQSETIARGDGYKIVSLCRLAAVFRGLRQKDAHAEFIERARALYENVDLRDLGSDLQHLPLYLAEEVAHTEAHGDAEMLLAQYREIILPALKSSSGDLDQFRAVESSIEAVLHEARGEVGKAIKAYTSSYRTYAQLDYRRRAAAIALRLARLTGKPRYIAYAEETLNNTSEKFWMTRDLVDMRRGSGPALTETEMAILRLIAHGNTYKEIAATRGVSVKTIGNHVQALLRKFDVHSRGELVARAVRHGLVALHNSSHRRASA